MAEPKSDEESDASTDADEDVQEGGTDAAPPPPPKKAPPFSVDLAEDSAPLEPIPGRVQFKICEFSNLRRPGTNEDKDSANIDVRLKLRIGGSHGAKDISAASPVIPGLQRKETKLEKPVAMTLDIVKPSDLQKAGLPLALSWELHEASGKSDKLLLGQGSLDFSKVYKCYGGKKRQIRLDLTVPSKDGQGEPEVTGEVLIDMQFFVAWPGMFVVTCFEARGLPNMEMVGKQDPFAEIKFAKQKQRSSTVKEGGENPVFSEDELMLWIDTTNWTEPMTLTLWDEDIGKNDFIGKADIDPLQFCADFSPQLHFLELFDKKGINKRGEFKINIQFFPAGRLCIQCFEGKNVRSPSNANMDLYVQFSLAGQIQSYKAKTKVDKRASDSPIWNETFEFWVVDHSSLKIEVFDHDLLTKDDLVGSNNLPLSTVFREGIRDGWVPIRARTTWGALEDRGEIKLHVDFSAHEGIGFPQKRPDADSYDHQERIYRDNVKLYHFQGLHHKHAEFKQEEKQDTTEVDKRFTDADIEAAFKFIDLDKNLIVGPAEIRHILTCMGEMITEEEVEMMIRLCDKSGNGSISFDEFYAMCRHPDPASDDFLRDDRAAFKAFSSKAPPPPGSASGQKGLAAIRAQENQRREEKRVYCQEFIRNNALRLPDLKRAFLRFRSIGTSKAYMVTFEELISTFDITFENDPSERDRLSRYRQMYNVFVDTQTARLDLRQFLLALNNFTNSDRNQRVNFCFYLYDVDNTGSLDATEVAAILKGNHMADEMVSVEGKAKTIMKQADKDGSGTVDLEEFVIVAEKFPSLMFPNFSSPAARAGIAGGTSRLSARSTARPASGMLAGTSYQNTGLSARAKGPQRAVVGQDTMFAGMPSSRRMAAAGGNASIAQQRQMQAMQRNAANLTARGMASARGQYSARMSARPSARQARLEGLR